METSLKIFKDNNGHPQFRGRFNNAHLLLEQKFPVLFESNSWITRLIIWKAH